MEFGERRNQITAGVGVLLASAALSGCVQEVVDAGQGINDQVIEESQPLLEGPDIEEAR